jgi:hypothetical protein
MESGESVIWQPSARRLACDFQCGYLLSDVPHEKHRAVLGKKGRRTGIGDRYGKPETALGLIPELSIAIKTEPYLLIVHNHFLQSAHNVLLLIVQMDSVTTVGPVSGQAKQQIVPMIRNLLGAAPFRRTVRQIEAGHTTGRDLREEHKTETAPGHDPKMVARRITNRQGTDRH